MFIFYISSLDYWRNELDLANNLLQKSEIELQKMKEDINHLESATYLCESEWKEKTRSLKRITAQHLTMLQGLSDKKELLKLRYKHEVDQFESKPNNLFNTTILSFFC